MGLIVKDKGVQAVYGPKADVLKSDIEDLLQSGADIPEPTVEATNKNEKNEEKHVLGIEKELFTVATGEVIALTDVNDPVFSQKMMGDGFAVIPATGEVTAPLSGKIVQYFPNQACNWAWKQQKEQKF